MRFKLHFLNLILLTTLSLQVSTQNYDQRIRQLQQQQLPFLPQQQQQQQQQQQLPAFDLLQRNQNAYEIPNAYAAYRNRGLPMFEEKFINQRNNFPTYNQNIPRPYPRPELGNTREEIQQQQQQQQQHQLPIHRQQSWTGRPIFVDYNPAEYPTTQHMPIAAGDVYPSLPHQSLHELNQPYNSQTYQRPFFDDDLYRQNEIVLPSSRIPFVPSHPAGSATPTSPSSSSPSSSPSSVTPFDYSAHFERYIRKYPQRLRPQFDGNYFRK